MSFTRTMEDAMTVAPCLSRSAAENATERSDRLIKEGAKGDNREGIRLIASRYGASIRRHAGFILNDTDEADEIVQEVFIRALKEERLLDPYFRIWGWLYRVTINLSLNRRRDLARRSQILSNEPYLVEPQPIPNPEEVVLKHQARQRFNVYLEQLSPAHAAIIQLRFEEDLSYLELADELRIKLGTVMSRLSRAKDNVRDLVPTKPDSF